MTEILKVFVLSLAVCSVTCLSAHPKIVEINDIETKSAIDDSLRDLLENLRYSLRCGFPDQGIPSLAPFYIKSAEINERGLLYNIQGNIRDFTVTGLDGYTVDVATFNLLQLRVSIGLTFPKISLRSLYDIDALLLRFIPIFGHGRLAFDVNDLSVQANGRLTLNIRTGRLNMTTLDIDVNMGSPFSDSTGVYDSRIVSTFFNIGFERMVQNVFENNKENLETSLENFLIPLANQHLNELTLQDLIDLIGGGGGSDGGSHLDPDTGDLICSANNEEEEQTTTSEYEPSDGTSTNVSPTTADGADEQTTGSTEQITEKAFESTTFPVPDDESNSSHFFFDKFQVMIITVASIISLVIL